jgi:predicted metalloprotease with PDZ domain
MDKDMESDRLRLTETVVNVEGESIRMLQVTAAGLAAVASIPMEEEGLGIDGEDTLDKDMESDRLRLNDTVVNMEGESI